MCEKGTGHPETKHYPSRVVSWGLWIYRKQDDGGEEKEKKMEEASQSRSTDTIIDPPSPIKRHMKWKMARTKKTGQMTSEATKEIADKIVSYFQLRIVIIFVYFVNE